MKPKMLNLQRRFFVRAGSLLLLLLVLCLGLTTARADAVSDLASFSIFDKVDLAQLAKSDVKTAHGPPMSNPRFLAVQSCYVALGSSLPSKSRRYADGINKASRTEGLSAL
jgi:hypothetical protein